MTRTSSSGIMAFVLLLALLSLTVLGDDQYLPSVNQPTIPELGADDVKGEYGPSRFTGAMTYTYALRVPSGTNGLAPEVSLTYNSQDLNGIPGVLGSSWTLSPNHVQRDTNGTLVNTSDDFFVLFFDGSRHLLAYNASEDRYHTRIETFFHIQKKTGGSNENGEYWLLRTTDGTQYRFGFTSQAELVSNLRNYTVRWHLDLVNDTHGNQIVYNYSEDPYAGDIGATYLEEIAYNNDRLRRITFGYEPAGPQAGRTSYENGLRSKRARRVSNISVAFNDSLVRRYDLTYEEHTGIELLSSIQLVGSDGTSTLPAEEFSYYHADTGYAENETWRPVTSFASSTGVDLGVRYVDVNGDGLLDVVYRKAPSSGATYMNNGSGWVNREVWSLPAILDIVDVNGADDGVRFADVNGDGLVDVLLSNTSDNDVYINNGTGWQSDDNWTVPTPFIGENGEDVGTRISDVNGDGLPDIVQSNDGGTNAVYLNNGSDWMGASGDWLLPSTFVDTDNNDLGRRLADINGDGLPDFLLADSGPPGSTQSWLNNGSGWTLNGSYSPPTHFINTSGGDHGTRIADVNGDGLLDIVIRETGGSGNAYLNNGSGYVSNTSWKPPYEIIQSGLNRGVRLADLNGDGHLDYTQSWDGGTDNGHLGQGRANYLLKTIKTVTGANVTIAYEQSTAYNNTGGDGLADLPFNVYAVKSLTTWNGLAGEQAITATTNYSYAGGYFHFAGDHSEFRGFAVVEETTPTGETIRHHFHQGDALRGREYQTLTYNASGALVENQTRNFSTQKVSGVLVATLDSQLTKTHDGAATPRVVQVNYTYDEYNNPTAISHLGDLGIDGDESFRERTFTYNTSAWIVDRKINDTLLASDGSTVVRQQLFTYNAFGDLLQEELVLLNGTNPVREYGYDSFGNRIGVINERNYTSNSTYDSATSTFAAALTNAKNQTSTFTYDHGFGTLLSEADSNGFRTNYSYDAFGRRETISRPGDTAASPTTSFSYENDGQAPERVSVTRKLNASLNTTEHYYLDGSRNIVQTKQSTEDEFSATAYQYDGKQRLTSETNPYPSNASYTGFNATAPNTTYGYDAQDRLVLVDKPDGARIQVLFDRNTTTVTDENGNQRSFVKNGRENIILVTEENDGEEYTTSYSYNGADDLLAINDTYGTAILYTYDSLGRKTAMDDPDMGDWTYAYDAASNLIRQTDNRGTSLTLSYDPLNRVLRKNSSSLEINYTYDDGVNGTLSREERDGVVISYGYDSRLRPVNETVTIDGGAHTTVYEYNSKDQAVTQQMPNGETIALAYNAHGRVESIEGILDDVDYNEQGQPTSKTFSNGLTSQLSYDNDTLRLTRITTGSVQEVNYSYDAAGNVVAIHDSVTGAAETFTYDDLNRLASAVKENASDTLYEFTYSLDAKGRLQTVVGFPQTITYSYGGTPYHAPATLTIEDGLVIEALSSLHNEGTTHVFELRVRNAGASSETINWSLDTGEAVVNSSAPATLKPGTQRAVFVEHDYSGNGTYTVNGSAAGTETVWETITLGVGAASRLIVTNQTSSKNVSQDAFFTFTAQVCCYDADCGEVNVSLDPKRIEYTHTTRQECVGDACVTSYFAAPRYGLEDGRWKPIDELRSFKGTIPVSCVVESDGIHQVECLDYNFTHRKLSISVDERVYGAAFPIKYYQRDGAGRLQEVTAKRETYTLGPGQSIDAWFAAGFFDEIHVGASSTNVTYVPNTAGLQGWWESTGGSLALYGWSDCDANTYSAGDIETISANDSNSLYGSGGGSANEYTYCHRLVWLINESAENITSMRAYGRWTGTTHSGADSITKALYIGNITGQSWTQLHKKENAWAEEQHSGSVTSGISDFVNGSKHVVTLLHYNASKSGSPSGAYSNLYYAQLDITTGNASGGGNESNETGKGLVSTTAGATPFYTTSSNPATINLNASQCQNVSWSVNATGDLNTSHTFFAYANKTSDLSVGNRTVNVTITIVQDAGNESGGNESGNSSLVYNETFESGKAGWTGCDNDSAYGGYIGKDDGSDWAICKSPDLNLSAYDAYRIEIDFWINDSTNAKHCVNTDTGSCKDPHYLIETDSGDMRLKQVPGYSTLTSAMPFNKNYTLTVVVNRTANTTSATLTYDSTTLFEDQTNSNVGSLGYDRYRFEMGDISGFSRIMNVRVYNVS